MAVVLFRRPARREPPPMVIRQVDVQVRISRAMPVRRQAIRAVMFVPAGLFTRTEMLRPAYGAGAEIVPPKGLRQTAGWDRQLKAATILRCAPA